MAQTTGETPSGLFDEGHRSRYAERLGVHPSFVYNVLGGRKKPNAQMLADVGLAPVKGRFYRNTTSKEG